MSAHYTVRVRDAKTQCILIQRQYVPTMVDVRDQIKLYKRMDWSRYRIVIDVMKHLTVTVKAPKAQQFKW